MGFHISIRDVIAEPDKVREIGPTLLASIRHDLCDQKPLVLGIYAGRPAEFLDEMVPSLAASCDGTLLAGIRMPGSVGSTPGMPRALGWGLTGETCRATAGIAIGVRQDPHRAAREAVPELPDAPAGHHLTALALVSRSESCGEIMAAIRVILPEGALTYCVSPRPEDGEGSCVTLGERTEKDGVVVILLASPSPIEFAPVRERLLAPVPPT